MAGEPVLMFYGEFFTCHYLLLPRDLTADRALMINFEDRNAVRSSESKQAESLEIFSEDFLFSGVL